ncbi:pirin family protein [Aquisalimonas lutea]|uniref:pirin family protein n=1 Tax=Aquisalimonas lutea TaxID=1327750 RepID=UPI0025B3E802|nr:pirin family protein [Aquisalimonas lutea]MDN3516380.1 pirin family protein [Aquisalimonas lutea]
MKAIRSVHAAPRHHWVGNGFPVRSLFSYDNHGRELDPFLLLDYAGPVTFAPARHRRGVSEHPHKGFETVTIVYEGEVEHRDSTGHGGVIGPGDVQWMTAGAGILHEEFHSEPFTRVGGPLQMVQLWVNLPSRAKEVEPGYQALRATEIPEVPLAGDAGTVRVIAGDLDGRAGPARTHTPMQVWDVRLNRDGRMTLEMPDGWPAAVAVLEGTVLVNDDSIVRDADLAILHRDGDTVSLEANNDARLLVLSGEPIGEPVVGYGPFVMNHQQDIDRALADFRQGRLISNAAP